MLEHAKPQERKNDDGQDEQQDSHRQTDLGLHMQDAGPVKIEGPFVVLRQALGSSFDAGMTGAVIPLVNDQARRSEHTPDEFVLVDQAAHERMKLRRRLANEDEINPVMPMPGEHRIEIGDFAASRETAETLPSLINHDVIARLTPEPPVIDAVLYLVGRLAGLSRDAGPFIVIPAAVVPPDVWHRDGLMIQQQLGNAAHHEAHRNLNLLAVGVLMLDASAHEWAQAAPHGEQRFTGARDARDELDSH